MLLHSPLLQQSLLLALPPLSDMLKLGGSLPAPQATEHAALRRQPHTLLYSLLTTHYDWPWLDGLPVFVLFFCFLVRACTPHLWAGTPEGDSTTTSSTAPGAT